MDWVMILERLKRQGWCYTYSTCIDLETRDKVYLLNLSRGEESLTKVSPTLEEAAKALSYLLEAPAT